MLVKTWYPTSAGPEIFIDGYVGPETNMLVPDKHIIFRILREVMVGTLN